MSYRITSTEKWKDLWFSDLSPNAKLLFFYFVENCDNAGFFEVNKKFMLFYTGLNEEQLMEAGTELWFKNFLKYQKKLPLNSASNIHKQIIGLLQYNLSDETKFKGNNIINSILPIELQLGKRNYAKKEVVDEQNTNEVTVAKIQRFIKPTSKEVYDYMVENEFEFAKVESEKFINFYETKGWKVGRNAMKKWKSAVANWMFYFYERNKIATDKKSKLQIIQQSHENNENIDWNEFYKEPKNEQFN